MDNKKIIEDVLMKFVDVNLSSDSARQWIASEICKKLEEPGYEAEQLFSTEKRERGIFEEQLLNIESTNQKTRELVQEESKLRNQQLKEFDKEINQSKNVKTKQKKVVSKKPKKTLKNIRKPRGKFL
jgi:phage replication-related protein YjqB (UPF0714/DUF867 family)